MTNQPRISSDPAVVEAVAVLRGQLSGSALRRVLQSLVTEHAEGVDAADLLIQQQANRFCEPSSVDAVALAEATATGLAAGSRRGFEPVQLSPLAPLGASQHFGSVAELNVITTTVLCEVVTDPTNGLALAGAYRRRIARDKATITRLAAVQRVARARQFDAPEALPHFSLLGLASIGPDRPKRRFETDEIARQITTLAEIIESIETPGSTRIEIGDNSGRRDEAVALADTLSAIAPTSVADPRPGEADHAPQLWARVVISTHEGPVEVGGSTTAPLAQELVGHDRDRIVASRLSLDQVLDLVPRHRRRVQ